ncbi:MAG TPA: hypothetical protein VK880_08660, partial [Anaerolineales bacterium]|nr:hypothetical protein [Anaerolineales bacterium]
IGWLQEVVGLTPAMAVGYLALIAAAALATRAIRPRQANEVAPLEKASCLCSPCMDQNIVVYPRRTNLS